MKFARDWKTRPFRQSLLLSGAFLLAVSCTEAPTQLDDELIGVAFAKGGKGGGKPGGPGGDDVPLRITVKSLDVSGDGGEEYVHGEMRVDARVLVDPANEEVDGMFVFEQGRRVIGLHVENTMGDTLFDGQIAGFMKTAGIFLGLTVGEPDSTRLTLAWNEDPWGYIVRWGKDCDLNEKPAKRVQVTLTNTAPRIWEVEGSDAWFCRGRRKGKAEEGDDVSQAATVAVFLTLMEN